MQEVRTPSRDVRDQRVGMNMNEVLELFVPTLKLLIQSYAVQESQVWVHEAMLFWHKISGAQVGWKRSAARQLGRIFFVMPGFHSKKYVKFREKINI